MQNELERYKNFDPTNAPVVKPNFVKKLQERHAIAQDQEKRYILLQK